ncbi:MAG: hypothetical protein ACD_22C00030G0006 [uncultured bacterium]|nr:MAG: hypothetical protein ACD_22C00030G0006 [uncultured bacterium]
MKENDIKIKKTLIITATNDRPTLLKQTMASVLTQTESNFLYVVVNNGPSEPTKDLVEKLQKEDGRIKYVEFNEVKGAAAARNKGLEYMDDSINFVKFLDDDDLFENRNSLKDLVEALDNKTGFVFAKVKKIDESGNKICITDKITQGLSTILEKASFPCQSVLFSREIMLRLGGFITLKSSEDLELMCRAFVLTKETGLKPKFLDKVVVCYRKHSNSLNFVNKQNGSKDQATALIRSRFSFACKGSL